MPGEMAAPRFHRLTIADISRETPDAVSLGFAGYPASFDPGVQAYVERSFELLTGGDKAYPLVFYCAGARCWESYNAALRAVALGYRTVFWYRGGVSAWQAAKLPTTHRIVHEVCR